MGRGRVGLVKWSAKIRLFDDVTKEKDKKCQNILFVTKKYLLLRYETKTKE